MSKSTILTAVFATTLATPVLAGTPPTPSKTTPDQMTVACGELGEAGESFSRGGLTGCVNTTTGAALSCDADGRCTDYFADPRYPRIKAILDGGATQQAPVKL